MKKSDLRTGMWVQYRNGKRLMVMLGTEDGDVIANSREWMPLRKYRDDLRHDGNYGEIDIVTIEDSKHAVDRISRENANIIWKRKEAKNLTRSEAEAILTEKLGVEVKITREAVKIW